MARRSLIVLLAAGVAGAAVSADAAPVTSPSEAAASERSRSATPSKRTTTANKSTKRTATKAAKRKQAAKARAKAKAKAKRAKLAKAKRGKRGKRVAVSRTPDRHTNYRTNMPRGFEWPPTAAMRAASRDCEIELDLMGVTWERAAPEGRIVSPIIVPSMELGGITYTPVYRKGPHKLECQFVRTLVAIGPQLRALGVREVRFGSIYRNTNVRVGGVTKPILSRHALGLAMDVNAFVDETGRAAVVETDYVKGDPLLLAIEDAINQTGKFRIVLTPKNDPISHDDHFHIEAAVDYTTGAATASTR